MGGNNYNNSTSSNVLSEHGYGEWVVVLYDPKGPCGIFKGHLAVAKDFHTIYGWKKSADNPTNREKKVMASFPSQNVSFVYDQRYMEAMGAEVDSEE